MTPDMERDTLVRPIANNLEEEEPLQHLEDTAIPLNMPISRQDSLFGHAGLEIASHINDSSANQT